MIPSHRRADLLDHCLTSVTRYAPPDTEIIVVDDGSTGAIVTDTATRYPGVKTIRRAKPGGFCAAANLGISAAAGTIVEMLNDDTEVGESWAEQALRWFADSRVAAVAPLVLQLDPARIARGLPLHIDSAGDDYDRGGFARKRGHGVLWDAGDRHFACPQPVWGVSACAGFYRRDTLLRAGGFPEHFRGYFEDVDLSFRLRRLGFLAIFEPGSVVRHRLSSTYGKRPSRHILEQQSCNEERVFWRNLPPRDLVRILPRHAAVVAAKALRRYGEGALLPWLLGRVRALLPLAER